MHIKETLDRRALILLTVLMSHAVIVLLLVRSARQTPAAAATAEEPLPQSRSRPRRRPRSIGTPGMEWTHPRLQFMSNGLPMFWSEWQAVRSQARSARSVGF